MPNLLEFCSCVKTHDDAIFFLFFIFIFYFLEKSLFSLYMVFSHEYEIYSWTESYQERSNLCFQMCQILGQKKVICVDTL